MHRNNRKIQILPITSSPYNIPMGKVYSEEQSKATKRATGNPVIGAHTTRIHDPQIIGEGLGLGHFCCI